MSPLKTFRSSSSLEKALTALLGADKCCFAPEDLAAYAYDAGALAKKAHWPLTVVFPESAEEVSALMAYAHKRHIPVIPRGAGSGLTGGAVPVRKGIVLSLARMNKILELDTKNLCAVVETGVVTADLQAAAGKEGLFYPPDPASQDISTIGGNIAENSGGMRAAKYGVTKHYVMGLEVVLADGRIVNLGSKCIKDVTGYSLTELFIGSEGTFGVITKAIVKLVTLPETVKTLAVCFDAMKGAGTVVPRVLKSGITPCTLEFIDAACLDAVRAVGIMGDSEDFVHPDTRAMLLMEVDGRAADVGRDADLIREICGDLGMLSFKMAESETERESLWHIRRSIHGALGVLCEEWLEEDISVPPAAIPDMLDALQTLAVAEDLRIPCFGHYGDGNIHLNAAEMDGPFSPERAAEIKKAIFAKTVEMGGCIAAEHGIGLAKKEYLSLNLSAPTLALALQVKQMLDPKGLLNPGKVFPRALWDQAYPRD